MFSTVGSTMVLLSLFSFANFTQDILSCRLPKILISRVEFLMLSLFWERQHSETEVLQQISSIVYNTWISCPQQKKKTKKKDYQTAVLVKGQKKYSYFIERLTEPHCRLDAAAVNTV